MPLPVAPVDYTPIVEPIPERDFKRPLAVETLFPVETLKMMVENPGVPIRVMTNVTESPLKKRAKFLEDGYYGVSFKTIGPRKITKGPDAGKFGIWAWYEPAPEQLKPASELESQAS